MTSYQTKFVNHYIRPYITDTLQRGYTLAGLTVLTIIIFGQFAVRPALNSVMATNQELTLGMEASQKLEIKIKALKKADQMLVQYQPQLKLLSQSVAVGGNPGNLLSSISNLAERKGVRLEFYQKETAHQGALGSSSFWLGLSGDFTNIINFLRDLDNTVSLVSVESVSLTQGKITNAAVLMNIYQTN